MPKTEISILIGLKGPDGNALAIVAIVSRELRAGGYAHLGDEYRKKALSGNYENLLAVTQEYVELVTL